MSSIQEGYKQTKIGVILEEWDFVMLKDITSKITDGTHKTPKYTTDGVVFISAKNIIGSNLNFKDIKYISQEEHEELQKRCFPESEDILLTKSGSLGSAVIIPKLEFEFSIFESLALLKINKTICSPHYLNQYLNSDYSQRYFDAITTGLAVKHLHLVDLRKTKIPLPSLKEQQKIANILSTWDNAISKQEQLIVVKETLKQGLMQRLLSGEVRFDGFDGEWEEVRLGDFLTERNIKTPKSREYPLMAFVANKGVAHKGERYNREFLVSDSDNKKYKQTEYGDFIYSSNNLETGSIGLNLYGSASISPVYSIFQIQEPNNYQFMGSFLVTKSLLHKMIRYRQGVIYGQWRIHESDFLKIKEKIPSSEEQHKIAQILTTADKEIELLKEELEALKEQKRGLMQRLLTGVVRVNKNKPFYKR